MDSYRECLSCGKKEMIKSVRNVPYKYKNKDTIVDNVKGWHCLNCGEVEFDQGEGVRFANAIKQFADAIDKETSIELARIRRKLKLTQKQASLITGGGANAFSRYERGKTKPMQAVINLFTLLDKNPELINQLPLL